jgi:hypothetical protein
MFVKKRGAAVFSQQRESFRIAIVDSLFTRSQGRSDLIILSDANRSPQLVPNCPA